MIETQMLATDISGRYIYPRNILPSSRDIDKECPDQAGQTTYALHRQLSSKQLSNRTNTAYPSAPCRQVRTLAIPMHGLFAPQMSSQSLSPRTLPDPESSRRTVCFGASACHFGDPGSRLTCSNINRIEYNTCLYTIRIYFDGDV